MAIGKVNIIGANLKFNQILRNGNNCSSYVNEVANGMLRGQFKATDARIFAHTVALHGLKDYLRASHTKGNISFVPNLSVGAQDIHWEEDGSFTNAPMSAADIKALGLKRTLIGHSETRVYFGVIDKQVAQKLEAAIKAGIFSTVCIGENIQEKNAGRTEEVLIKQITDGIVPALSALQSGQLPFDLAYEPVYAIKGFAKLWGLEPVPPKSADIKMAHNIIREILKKHGIPEVNILYGGSADEKNAESLLSLPYVNGLLIGTASWNPENLLKIIGVAEKVSNMTA